MANNIKVYRVGYYNFSSDVLSNNNISIGTSGCGYIFRNAYNYNLKIDDVVFIVGNNKICLGKILNIEEYKDMQDFKTKTGYDFCTQIKNILGKVDVSNARKAINNEIRRNELEKIINEKYEKISKIKILEQMCKDDNELSALLKEFKDLDNELEQQ